MTDAFECDRCGDLYGNPPEIRLATTGAEETGGDVSLIREDTGSTALEREQSIGSTRSRSRTYSGYKIKHGDLCEDCAEELREFWGEDDE